MQTKKLKIRDLTMRDGQQSLFATRMSQADIDRLLPLYENAGFFAIEVWGGAVPDSVMRYLDESPWNRLRSVSKVMQGKSLLTALSRGRNLFGYVPYPDNVLEGFYKEAIANGLNVMLANAVLLLLAYPLMFVVEKAFGFVSAVTLFELSDTNKTVLRRLSEVAPGTFQHSIMVSNLASEIATRIGARALLVRVGALYHDIGKMRHPVFYTENQASINPHTRLSETESAQVIVSHVTEGLRLAEKESLPSVIQDFIRTHHGDGLVAYFYVQYKNSHPDEAVDEALFRYPGPNPFTREQAILMMADGVEAASRSLKEYTEESIACLVNRIIDTQVQNGFFHDCPITFRDIQTAKDVLIERLKTIYHTRIAYPELHVKQEPKDTEATVQ